MKTFFKTILYGLEAICLSAMSVFSIIASIILFANLHTLVGWWVLIYFILALFALAFGILFMWELGNMIKNTKENNQEKLL